MCDLKALTLPDSNYCLAIMLNGAADFYCCSSLVLAPVFMNDNNNVLLDVGNDSFKVQQPIRMSFFVPQ